MTKDKDLKRLARDRAEKTGESYSTARRQLVDKQSNATSEAPSSGGPTAWFGLDSDGRLVPPLARDEARMAGHSWMEPEHLLLGLLSMGTVLATFQAMRVSPVAVRHHIQRALPPARDARVNPTMSSSALVGLTLAHEEAVTRGSTTGASSIDLLVALTRLTGAARNVLAEFGASERRLRDHLGYPDPSTPSAVRAAIVNRLLPIFGQDTDRLTGLIGDLEVDEHDGRVVVSITSERSLALLRFADDIQAAAESVTGERTVVNIFAAR